MNRQSKPPGGGPPDEPMLDLPLGHEAEEEPSAPAAPAARATPVAPSAAGAGSRSARPLPWILLLVALVIAALIAGYFLSRDPARLSASTSLADFGSVQFGESEVPEPATLELTVANAGVRRASIRTVSVAGEAAEEFVVLSDGCGGQRLRGGETCPVQLAFSPRADGPRQATLHVAAEDSGISIAIPLLGVGASGRLAALPGEVDFGARPVDEGGPAADVTVDNRGSAPVEIAELSLEGAAASDFAVSGCRNRVLAPGESCGVRVVFRPRAEGERRASLRVISDASGRPPLVWLIGLGEPRRPRLELAPAALDLGAALVGGEPTTTTVTVRNRGDAPAAVASSTVADDGLGFAVGDDGCSGTEVAPGGSCEIAVSWAPAAAGPAETSLRIALGTGDEGASLPLSGRGEGASLTAEPERLDFGTLQLGANRESFLTLANPGSVVVPLGPIEIEGSSEFALGGDCRPGARLAPAGSCTVTVRFTPRSPGDRSARILVRAAGVTLGVPLSGAGAQPPRPRAEVRPDRLSFETRAVGERGPIREVRIANTGRARLPLAGFSVEGAHAADFRLVPGSCEGASYIAPGAECTVGVRFVPGAAGARSGDLIVRHGGPGGSARVQLSGSGS